MKSRVVAIIVGLAWLLCSMSVRGEAVVAPAWQAVTECAVSPSDCPSPGVPAANLVDGVVNPPCEEFCAGDDWRHIGKLHLISASPSLPFNCGRNHSSHIPYFARAFPCAGLTLLCRLNV